ncbi:MAG: hypothetical protein QOI59_5084 [Gammaproteobacteria bacterium]|nr:hypothetical protein [Gammaproteobacteria bacterium]
MPSVNQLSVCDAAYLAGIIDGEGTITLTRIHRGENRRPVLSISSTESALLRYVRSAIGTGRITSKVCSRPHHSPSFAYVIAGRQVLAVLSQITPFLRTYKAERARLLLEEYVAVTPRNGRYTPTQHALREQFENRFFAISIRAPSMRSVTSAREPSPSPVIDQTG